MRIWKPSVHAIEYKYFGLNTVQMNKCVRKMVHDSITARSDPDVNNVHNAMYENRGDDLRTSSVHSDFFPAANLERWSCSLDTQVRCDRVLLATASPLDLE